MDINEQILELIAEMNTEINDGFNKVHSEMNDSFSKLYSDMNNGFDKVYSTMGEEFNKVYAEFKDIQMTLENETNKNIQLIAEGHFNLNRKLDDALKVENEKELMLIRLTRLENEIRRLKTRIE